MESIIYQATLAPKSEEPNDPVHQIGKDGIPVLTPVEDDLVAQAQLLDERLSKSTSAELAPEVVMVKPEQVLAAKRHAIVLRRIVRDVQKSPAPPATFQPVLMSAADQLDKLALALAEISTAMEKTKDVVQAPAPTLVTPEQVLSRQAAVAESPSVVEPEKVVITEIVNSPELEAELALAKQRALRFEQALNAICEVLDKAADRPVEQWTISSAAEVANQMGDLATLALEEFKTPSARAEDTDSDYIEHRA